MKKTVGAMPYWERPGAKKKGRGQLWEYSHIIFLSVKFGVSYKMASAYAGFEDFG